MRYLRILIVIGVIAGVYLLGRSLLATSKARSGARAEARAQEAEQRECRARLAQFHKAWEAYQADHKGAAPPTIVSLVPKYVSDADLFFCPTAQRWKSKAVMAQGAITVGRRQYPVTYGFLGLTSGFARSQKQLGDRAPLIICEAHQEAIYRAAYQAKPPLGVFDSEQRRGLIAEVREAPVLVVRKNGTVDTLDATGNP